MAPGSHIPPELLPLNIDLSDPLSTKYRHRRTAIMSFSSSRGSTPSTSPSSRPINISSMSRSSPTDITSTRPSLYSSNSTYQPFGTCLRRPSNERPSAYVSDEDLLGADDVQCLREAPPPPRPAEMWLARPLLPPVECKPRRSSSSHHKSQKEKASLKV